MVVLRDMRESDIEDYVRWFVHDTEWMDWDAPWEWSAPAPEDEERRSWAAYYEQVRSLPAGTPRWKYEVDLDGKHVGWVSAYTDLEYLDNPDGSPAVGIDLPEQTARGRGVGTEALGQFVRELRSRGYSRVYTQTWSGNARMLRVAEKLGFVELCRRRGHRTVKGEPCDAITLVLEE